ARGGARQGRPPRAARATARGTGEPLLPTPVRLPGWSGGETGPAFRIRSRVVSAVHGRRAERTEAGRPPGAPLLLEPALGPGPTHVEPRRMVRRDREEAAPRRAGGYRRKRGARAGARRVDRPDPRPATWEDGGRPARRTRDRKADLAHDLPARGGALRRAPR